MQNWDEDIEKILSGLRTVAVPGEIGRRILRHLQKNNVRLIFQ